MKPVDEHAGAEIDAWVSTALASIPRDPATGHGRNAGPPIRALLDQVQATYGWAGIYRVALACARIATDGVTPWSSDEQRERHAYTHFGVEGEEHPETPAGYRASRFVVALMNGEEADAWLEFTRWQPDEASPPSPQLRQALWGLLQSAWNRQAGNSLTWAVGPGSRWPPECDFCCSATARTMFRCRPFRMASREDAFGGEMGRLTLEYTDVEYWYACRLCAQFVQADDWAALWRRYCQCNPDRGPNPDNIRRTWQAVAENLIRRRPYPLPKTRPEQATT